MLDNLVLGFETALTPENIFWCFIGVLVGTVIGVLPGLGSATGVAVLLPLTLTFEPVTALIMLAGIYYGSQYGGTITSVLISTPGEASSVVTTIDGYQMARQGRAGAALAISAIGSFVAAIISLALLILLAPPFAEFALRVRATGDAGHDGPRPGHDRQFRRGQPPPRPAHGRGRAADRVRRRRHGQRHLPLHVRLDLPALRDPVRRGDDRPVRGR